MGALADGTAIKIREYEKRIAQLEAELDKFKNGYQGGCYACETVGEKNVQLEAENAELRLEIIAATGQAQTALEEKEKMSNSKGMLDAIRAQVAGLTEGQRIFMANHMYKHYGVYPTKLREYVPEDAPAQLKYKVGDVVVVRYDGNNGYDSALNDLVAGDQGIITQVDPADERLPYEVFLVDDYGTEVREWAAEDQIRKV